MTMKVLRRNHDVGLDVILPDNTRVISVEKFTAQRFSVVDRCTKAKIGTYSMSDLVSKFGGI